MNKKGISGVIPIVTTLMIVGLVLGIGFLVLEEFSENLETAGQTESWNNATNQSTNTFTNSFIINDTVVITNATPVTISSGNYTLTSNADGYATAAILTDAGMVEFGGQNLTVTFTQGSDARTGVEDTIDAATNVNDWLAIIAILAIVGVLLAIVFGVLPTIRGGRGGGGIAEI